MRPLIGLVIMAFAMSAFSAAHTAEIIAKRSLRVGMIVEPGDLAATENHLDDHVSAFVGLEVRKAVFAGRAVGPVNFGPPTLVRRGSLGLRTEGRALSAGGIGDRVEVMNLDTRITVRATIVGEGRVEVRR